MEIAIHSKVQAIPYREALQWMVPPVEQAVREAVAMKIPSVVMYAPAIVCIMPMAVVVRVPGVVPEEESSYHLRT